MVRGKKTSSTAMLKRHGFKESDDRPIVLRYLSNTSTILEPRSDAGRLSSIFIGRTGNMMYTYSALFGIARRNGMHPVISTHNPLLKLFHINVTVVQSDRPGRGWVKFATKRHIYDKHIAESRYSKCGDITVKGTAKGMVRITVKVQLKVWGELQLRVQLGVR